MRLSFLTCCAVSLSIVFFSSCQKEGSLESDNPGNGFTATADSNYLSKQTFVESNGSSVDSGATFYHFDSQKRVISTASKDLGSTIPSMDTDSTVYFYHGSDTLPYKVFHTEFSSGYHDTAETYLTYNMIGKQVGDSILSSSDFGGSYTKIKEIGNFSYNGNRIYRQTYLTALYDPTGMLGLYNSRDTVTLDSHGNALTLREYSEDLSGNIGQDYLNSFAYDTNPSPYVKLNINYIFPVAFGADYEYSQLGCMNNRTYWREESPGGQPGGNVYLDVAGQYSYLPSGYPFMLLDGNIPPTFYDKFLYTYRSL